jgi:CRISPR-associated protein (TIGR02584 family)
MKKNILLCVTGMTPQIITETLYALTQSYKKSIDEIRVITTIAGRNRIMKDLLNKESGKFFEFCRDYNLSPSSIKFDETCIYLLHKNDGSMLDDIRSEADNALAADQISDIVRELTKDPNLTLHASIAGGRKTMGIYLTIAMQLFGRMEDRISHVLVSEDFETHPDFYYIPKIDRELDIRDKHGNFIKRVSTSNAEIHLADIPFIKLRSLLTDWLEKQRLTYCDLVQQAQEDLDILESVYDLNIDLTKQIIKLANRIAKLTHMQLFIYLLFIHLKEQNRGSNGFVTLDEINREDIELVLRKITSARGDEVGIEENYYGRFKFLDTLVPELESKKTIDRKALQKTFTEGISKINSMFEHALFPEKYFILKDGKRGSFRYGLQVSPDRVKFS